MITWTTERRKLSDLIPWPRNPRKINDAQGKRLAESFDEFGQVETIAIAPNGDILNGHQRLKVLAAKHGKDYTVDVRVASRPLTEKEREKLTVYLHKGAAGEFDMDFLLAEFDMGELVEWGFDEVELGFGEPVADPMQEWRDMPSFEHEDLTAYRSLIVNFANPADLDKFASLVGQKLTDKTRSIWYPQAEITRYADKRYADES